jgi:hypothetical protein
LRLSAIERRGLGLNRGSDDHAKTHADTADNEQELATKTIDSPCSVEGEQDTECGVESVDQSDGVGSLEDLLVYNGRVRVKSTLSSDLLSSVDDHCDVHTLTNRLVLPERRVAAGNSLSLKLDGLTDDEDLIVDLLLCISNTGQGLLRSVVVLVLLDVPAWRFGDKEDLRQDDDGHQNLEYDNHLPVPLAELLRMLGAGVVDPVCDEGTDRVEHLPEGHNLTTDLRGCEFSDIDGTSSCQWFSCRCEVADRCNSLNARP